MGVRKNSMDRYGKENIMSRSMHLTLFSVFMWIAMVTQPISATAEISCGSICAGNIDQGKHDCDYLTYDKELRNQCYEILNKTNCLDLCKNKICKNPKITRPDGNASLGMKGEGNIHCDK